MHELKKSFFSSPSLKLVVLVVLVAALGIDAGLNRARVGTSAHLRYGHARGHYPKVEDFKPPEGYQPVKGYETLISAASAPSSSSSLSQTTNNNKGLGVGTTVAAASTAGYSTYGGPSSKQSSAPAVASTSSAPATAYTNSPQWYNYYQNNQSPSYNQQKPSSPSSSSSSSSSNYNNNNDDNNYQYQYSNSNLPSSSSSSSSSSYNNRNPFYPSYTQYQQQQQSPAYYQPPPPPNYYPPPPNYYPPPPPSPYDYSNTNPSQQQTMDMSSYYSATTQSPYKNNYQQYTTSSNKFSFPLLPTIRNPAAASSQSSNGEPNWRRTPAPNLMEYTLSKVRPVDFWKESNNEQQQQQQQQHQQQHQQQQQQQYRPMPVSTLPPPPPPPMPTQQTPPQYSTFRPPPSDTTTVDWKQVFQESKNKEKDRWNLGSHASSGVDDNCMKCLCFIESWCSDVGCVWDQGSLSCGWYQLKYEYWIDCGQPGGGWKECANSKSCAEGCVKRYLGRYSQFCTIGSSCPDLARIHNGGPYGCSSNSTEYYGWLIARCLKREAPYENIDTFPIPNS